MISKLKVGDNFEMNRTFSLQDVIEFSEISGDKNPIHIDPNYAASSVFGAPIVQGLFVASLFSKIIANHLPGAGSIYLHQSLDFKSPIYHERNVIARVVILSLREDKPIYELKTTCIDDAGKLLIDGHAVVLKK